MVLAWEYDECDRDYHSGSDKEYKDNAEKGKCPERHVAAPSSLMLLVKSWRTRSTLAPGKS